MESPHKVKYTVIGVLLAVLVASVPALAAAKSPVDDGPMLDPNTQFYVPKPNHGAIAQIAALTSRGDKANANLIEQMIELPQAVWFEGGTPKQVQQDVKNTVGAPASTTRRTWTISPLGA